MKAIRKYFKTTLCFMAFAVMSFMFALNPIGSVFAAGEMKAYAEYFSAVQMPNSTVDILANDTFMIPYLTGGLASSSYNIYVISPSGQTHIYSVDGNTSNDDLTYFNVDDDDYLSINALNDGTYTIIYNVGNYYSTEYKIKVTNVSYLLDFSNYDTTDTDNYGLKYLIASNYATGDTLTLPTPTVVYATADDNGNYTDSGNTFDMSTVKVTYNGGVVEVNDVTTVDGEDYNLYTEDAGVYTLNFAVEGTYTIEYSYPYGSNAPTVTYTITVSDDFTQPTSSDLQFADVTMPTFELGETITLPSLTLSDGNSDNADYNITSIRISKTNPDNTVTAGSEIYVELTNNTMTFDLTLAEFQKNYTAGTLTYADLKGTYYVTYTVEDAYGNVKTLTKIVRDVTDSTNPTVYMAYEYEVKDGAVKAGTTVDTNYAVELKETYGYAELIFPAIYAEDSVSSYSEFTFIRYIKNTSTGEIYYLDNKKIVDGEPVEVTEGKSGYNYYYSSRSQSMPGANQYVQMQFTAKGEAEDEDDYAGTYQLYYYVISNTVTSQESYLYESGTTRYSFTISSTANLTKIDAPATVEFNNLSSTKAYASGDTISVNITAKDATDTRLKNIVFYYTTAKNGYTDPFATYLAEAIQAAINAETTATFITCNVLDSTTFYDYMAERYNDFTICEQDEDSNTTFSVTWPTVSGTNTSVTIVALSMNYDGNYDYATKTFTLKNTTEQDPPAFDSSTGIIDGGDLFYTATTATAVATYATVSENDLVVGRYIYDDDGEITGYETTYTDSDGVTQTYTTLGVGQAETVTLPKISFTDDDSSLALSVAYYIDTPISENGVKYLGTIGSKVSGNTIYGGTITTTDVGTYYIVYTATDDAGNTTCVFFSFVVVDTSDIKLSVTATTTDEETSISGGTITGYPDAIVNFDVSVLSTYDSSDVTTACKIDYDVDTAGQALRYVRTNDGEYSFQFLDAGDYSVIFTATHTDGRTATSRVFYVTISTPTLAWNEDISVSSYAATGAEIVLPSATASEGNTKAKVTVTVKDPNGDEWTTVTDTSIDITSDTAYVDNNQSLGTYKDGNYVLLQVRGDVEVWVFYTDESTVGTYTVTYTATTDNSTITQSFSIKVGDNVAPTISMNYVDELSQDIVYDGNDIEYTIDLSTSSKTLVITATSNGKELFSYDTGLTIKDKNDAGTTTTMTSWSELEVTLSSDDGIVEEDSDNEGVYYISGTGTCTLTLTIPDSNDNVATKTISFNVVATDSTSSSISDTTIGVILIIVSLVVLAGVILFFTFTGRKGDGTKSSSKKKSTKKEKKEVEDKDETASDDAKTGEIE